MWAVCMCKNPRNLLVAKGIKMVLWCIGWNQCDLAAANMDLFLGPGLGPRSNIMPMWEGVPFRGSTRDPFLLPKGIVVYPTNEDALIYLLPR